MTSNAPTATAPPPPLATRYGSPLGVPSRTRFRVLAFMCSLALLLYLDRVCIGVAMPLIQDDLGLSERDKGFIFSAFTLAYCLFEVPSGHWGDRHGSRGIITRIVTWWSAFTAMTGACVGFWSLILVRFLFGAGEAGAFPNVARVVTKWFPVADRGKARGAITTASLVGGAISPLLAALLMKYVGWRAMFGIFGVVGVVWALLFYRWFRDDPAQHRGVNAEELAVIRAQPAGAPDGDDPSNAASDDSHPSAAAASGVPWRIVFSSPNMYLLALIMMFSGILSYVQFQWFPTYLKLRGQNTMSTGWLTSAVQAGGAIGCLTGGILADRVVRRMAGSRSPWGRRLTGAAALLMASLSVLGVQVVDSVMMVTLLNAAAQLFVQFAIPTWWAAVAEVSGRHGAAMWGLMNSLGGLGIMASTLGVGAFVQHEMDAGQPALAAWSTVFLAVSGGLLIAAICWLKVDPRRSIVNRASR